MSIIRHIIVLLILVFSNPAHTQTEAEIKGKAEQLFEKEQYVDATSLFLRLLSLQPRDHDYNYKYGACLLYNSRKKSDAIRYLAYAVLNESIDPNAHFFLGKAYHLNFQFNDAIKEYAKYQSLTSEKGKYNQEAERNSEMCRNGKQLLSTITEIIVSKKTEINAADFFRIYDLSNIGGSFVVAADFQSKNDKKQGHIPLIHFPVGTDKIVYASYGDENQKDIYIVRRLPDGKFSLPLKIQGSVNTEFEEDYPYLHPNGNYLYFSSKGHNSMGGFDVFRSRFDPDNNTYGPPENIDFAISSPDDDILYVVDKDDKNAYFASSRQSQDGKLFVYQVRVDRVPIQLAIVKGSFQSGINTDNKSMTVEVVDLLTDKKVGIFNTNKDGSYLITFPKGGKYEYRVKVDGSTENFTAKIEIPFLKEFKPLKQKMLHEVKDNKETIRVVNLFNEEVEDAQAIIAQVLKERSDLNVNQNQFDIEGIEQQKEILAIFSDLGFKELSLKDVGLLLESQSDKFNKEKSTDSEGSSISNALALELVNDIKKIDENIKKLVREADQSASTEVKFGLLIEAEKLVKVRNLKFEEITTINSLAAKLSGGGLNEEELKRFEALSKSVSAAMKSNNDSLALQKIIKEGQLVKDAFNGKPNNFSDELNKKILKNKEDINKSTALDQALFAQISETESEIVSLENQKNQAKDKLKSEFDSKIAYKKEQKQELENQRKVVLTKQGTLLNIKSDLESELSKIERLENFTGNMVSLAELEKSKSELNSNNMNSLAQYVSTQIVELKESNPELASISGNRNVSERQIDNYKAEINKLENDPTLSITQKNESIIKLNNELLAKLDQRNKEIKKLRETDRFDELLLAEENTNITYANKLKKQIEEIENSSNATIERPLITKESLVEKINPSLTSNLQEISNSSQNEVEKQTTLLGVYQSYQTKLESEKALKTEALAKDGSNKIAMQELNLLNELITENEKKITETNQALKLAEKNNAIKVTSEQPLITKESLVEKINPSLTSNLQEINNSSQNEVEKQTALLGEYQSYQTKLESEKALKTEVLAKDGSNKIAKQELNLLNELITENEKKITETNQSLQLAEKNNAINVTSEQPLITKESLVEKINPSLTSNLQEISNSSQNEVEKQTALLAEYQSYQTKLESEKANKTEVLAKDGSDKTAKQELILLNELLNDTKIEIVNLQNSIAQLENKEEVFTSEELIQKVDEDYFADITKLEREENSIEKFENLIKREQQLQNQIETRIANNQLKLLTATSKVQIQTELDQLSILYQESINRNNLSFSESESLRVNQNSSVNTGFNSELYLTELRSTLPSENQRILNSEENNLQILQQKEQILTEHIQSLKNKKNEIIQGESGTKKEELKLVESEIEKFDKQLDLVQASLNDVKTNNLNEINSPVERLISEVNELKKLEKQISGDLTSNQISDKERKEKQKELDDVVKAINKKENSLLESRLIENQNQIDQSLSSISNEEVKEIVILSNIKTKALKDNLESERTEEARNYLLSEIEKEQERSIELLTQSKMVERQKEIEAEYSIGSLNSKSELEARKRSVQVEIGQVETLIQRNEKELLTNGISSVLSKDIEIQQKNKSLLEVELELINDQLSSKTERKSLVNSNSKNKEVSFQKEFEIASSPEYEVFATAAAKVLSIEEKITILEREEAIAKSQINTLISEELKTKISKEEEIGELVAKIRSFRVEMGELETEQVKNKTKLLSATPKLEEEAATYENLVLRSVNPIKKGNVAVDLVKLPTNGIEIQSNSATGIERVTPITVGLEAPSGLVYRVQVGAFAKPIPDELFREFTPVSGELIPNTAITRYMAGYFNNSASVSDAKSKIQNLGYADAFVVAYCDGKRISFSEARILEQSKQCIARGTNEIMIEVAEMTAQKLGLVDTSLQVKPVSQYQYTQMKGAVNATPIETVEGLFFTVQVGVFNKPVMEGELLDLDPLMTFRLPNGQIRYSSGIFNSVDQAKQKQIEANEKGILDAFITAYYNGKRISWSEGMALIDKQGNGVLADIKSLENGNVNAVDKQIELAKPIIVFKESKNNKEKELNAYQWFSNDVYTYYPKDDLNSYTRIGSFYFDARDGRIKSKFYSDSTDQLKDFNDKFKKEEVKNKSLDVSNELKILKISSPNGVLKGDFADWFIRLNFRSDVLKTENGIEIRIFEVDVKNIEDLKNELSIFGLTAEIEGE